MACALPPRVGGGLLASEEAAVQGFWLPCLFYFLAASSMMLLEIWGGTVIEKYLFRWTGAEGRIKNAFFIIMAAYFTTMVAMFPFLMAGAGLLRGFALTTMMGISFGVFVTRPAYAAIIEILLKD